MKIKLIVVLVALAVLFTGCTKKVEITPTEEVKMEKPSPTATKEEETNKSSMDEGFSVLSYYIEKMGDVAEYIEMGIDNSGATELSMEFLTIKMSSAQLAAALYVYETFGENWDSGIMTDEDYNITTQTTMTTENGVLTYKNVAYETKEAQKEIVITIVKYYPSSGIVQLKTNIAEPKSEAVYQFYLDDSGVLYYVFAETAANTLFTDVMYFTGNFIGIAKAWFDGVSELTLPYDLSEAKPASYEDLLVYDNYRVKFTYNGTLCEYAIND